MEREQVSEWLEAQKTVISEDLTALALQQLDFLAAVDRRRFLYGGPLLERAIHRYKACWLPLLARFTESGDSDGSLLVPLDCEWIWHCHRLNPVQYKKDCEELYGRVLDSKNVQSTVGEKSELRTAEIWGKCCPDEPFQLDLETKFIEFTEISNDITYDLVSAVRRQSSFYYQVSRPIMRDKCFLDGAVARYKSFLHLVKSNTEKSMKCFCVPTYDIDLIWHSHQLQPISYQRDVVNLLGKVLEHDDTDFDRSKGKKLDTGFSGITKQWEDTYGLRYWRAGAMYRGTVPALLESTPCLSIFSQMNVLGSYWPEASLTLQQVMVVEVFVEIMEIRNLPSSQKGNVFVSISKKKPDMFMNGSFNLTIFSETGEKKVAGFECEPVGDLVLTVMTKSKHAETIGEVSISLEEMMDPNAELSLIRWFELKPYSRNANSNPVCLRVAASCTAPIPAPHVFEMLKLLPFSVNSCKFPLPKMAQNMQSWTYFRDGYESDIFFLQMRKSRKTGGKGNSIWKHSIFGKARLSRTSFLLAEYVENTWLFKNSDLSLRVEQKTNQVGLMVELKGFDQLKLFPGRRLEYQPKYVHEAEVDEFMTVVEFSSDYPYGKAIALFDLKFATVKVSEDWFAVPALVLAFILFNLVKKGQPVSVAPIRENLSDTNPLLKEQEAKRCGDSTNSADCGGCGGGCGSMGIKSSGCGGCGGGGGCGSCGAEVNGNGTRGELVTSKG